MKRSVILVIDDEVSHFDVIEALFNRQNYQLYYAANGEDAIASLDAYQPDLILLDVLMPGSNGIEVCRQIKALPQWKRVPIIVVTIIDTKRILTSCVNAGADDWITKPFDSIELHTRVQSMLEIKQQRDENQILSRIQTNTVNLLESTLDELRSSLTPQLSHNDLFTRVEQSARRLETLTAKFQIYMELELVTNSSMRLPVDDKTTLSSVIKTLGDLAQSYNRYDDLILLIDDTEISVPIRYLSIIFNELVDNALKFSLPKTPITVRSGILEDCLTLSVHNLGQAMTETQIATIDDAIQFDRNAYGPSNNGLGLKIVKRIVSLMDGQLMIASDNQQGTMIHIMLPLKSS